ncbi:MAG: hypothetical protein ACI4JA_02655 [Oscillospiraceae bacterium]
MAKGEKKSKKGLIIGIIAVIAVVGVIGASGGKDSKKDDSSKNDIVSVDGSSGNAFTIDEQTLWEVDGVKITATGIDEDSLWGSQIKVLVENNSEKDIGIGADAVIVNGYMINDLTSITVTAGNKSNDDITLFSSELEAAGIEHIGEIELYLHTFDPETFETLKSSECITIKTSDYDKMDKENDIKGVTLFDKDGVKIVGQYVDEDSFWGQAVLLYIENNSKKNIIVQCDDVSVNGYMVSALLSADVYAGKKSFDDITLLQSDLDENGITSIDTIETSFRILDEDFNEIANSGKVSFSTK